MARGPRGTGPPEARGPMQLHRLHRPKAGPALRIVKLIKDDKIFVV